MSTENASEVSRGPLAGIRILDLSRVLAGPFCSMILGDLGAEILKVEELGAGDSGRAVAPFANGASHFDLTVNRNKKGIAVDARTDAGRQVILDLARHCDVVLENFRPEVMDRLGLSSAALKAVNPDIIVCSISGFGKGNALSNKPSFDIVAQALSGIMSVNGDPDSGPLKLGISLGDLGAGIWAAVGILAALVRRQQGGKAVDIDLSMLDALMAFLATQATAQSMTGEAPARTGNNSSSVVPYGMFPVADGNIILALHLGSFWRKFCEAVGRPQWSDDPRFRKAASRRENRLELEKEMAEVLITKSGAQWAVIFDQHDIPNSAVLDIRQAMAQPVTRERGLVQRVAHPQAGEVEMIGSPLKFIGDMAKPNPLPAPLHGQHTLEVLSKLLGYDSPRLEQLLKDNVIGIAHVKNH